MCICVPNNYHNEQKANKPFRACKKKAAAVNLWPVNKNFLACRRTKLKQNQETLKETGSEREREIPVNSECERERQLAG